MNNLIKAYLDENYINSKNDLFSAFIEKLSKFTKQNNYFTLVTMHSWLFLQYFKPLRKNILDNSSMVNLLHLGTRAFEEIGGEIVQSATYVIRKEKSHIKLKGKYIDLTSYNSSESKELKFLEKNYCEFNVVQNSFNKIPEYPFSYWISDKFRNLFENKLFKEKFVSCGQNLTGNNDKYLRNIWEVDSAQIGIDKKWLFYAKGGGFRKWYGNIDYIVNWSNEAIEHYKTDKICRLIPEKYWYSKGITWSYICTTDPSFRVLTENATCDIGGSSIFFDNYESYYYFLGMLNNKISREIFRIINPTMNFGTGIIEKLPTLVDKVDRVNTLVKDSIELSQQDWDLFETSWDFKVHPLLKLLDKDEQHSISSIFRIWETECEEAFNQLKSNEEELNRIFIDIYGIQDELTPEVEEKDITIRKADRERDIKSFISYAVGCMLGRYSIDAEGLIYAGGDFKDKWNLDDKKVRKIEKDKDGNIISDSWIEATFLPDSDNVIPITEDEYFEDDIVSRFIDFVRTVYGNETLEENLDFIADSIGRKPSETARQAIRRYFIKDFYKDHLKIYQKRPIYWMFESGKNDGFKTLVYMHRYNHQTVAKVRTDYLHTLQRKYEAEIQRQQLIVDSEEYTAKDRTAAKKKIDRISKQIEECREYDQVVAHLANEKISIDLDDGVKVNYEKFQGVMVINSKDKEVKMDLLAKI